MSSQAISSAKTKSLVQPLFSGPLDIVGDVHGEIEALQTLLRLLGYEEDGSHSKERRLVFLGDLTDRGPDSPAVVKLVKQLVDSGRAQCVLGNHDFNILHGDKKHDNHWFFGEEWSLDDSGEPTPAVLADDDTRQLVLVFFRSLPLALEREDLRVVHACWDEPLVRIARQSTDVVALYNEYFNQIRADNNAHPERDKIDRCLEHQNNNPVKVLTSGREQRIQEPFSASGKLRYEKRVSWWEEYQEQAWIVFGHYSIPREEASFNARAICADFAVAKRWMERKVGFTDVTFQGMLGAVRWPEKVIMYDDGNIVQIDA